MADEIGMQLERSESGWIVRVPESVVGALGILEGHRVTLRPISRQIDEIRYAMAETRGRLPTYPFDREDWDGRDATPRLDCDPPAFEWSSAPIKRIA